MSRGDERFVFFQFLLRCSDQEQSRNCSLILVSGFIHDVSAFLDEHPGGRNYLTAYIGKDATTAIFGGVYDHSNAAHNVNTLPPFSIWLTNNDNVSAVGDDASWSFAWRFGTRQ